jgi:hypothetical protein
VDRVKSNVSHARQLTIDGHKRRDAKLVDKESQVRLRKIEVGYWVQRDVFVPCWDCQGKFHLRTHSHTHTHTHTLTRTSRA